MKPRATIITGYGVNCEEETAFALNKAGAQATIVHINDIIADPAILEQTEILAFPGGFSYGDDTGSGKALANKIKNNLKSEIERFINEQKLIIGICNGFQVLVSLGLLPAIGKDYGKTEVALLHNAKARFECRWVKLKNVSKKCVFTKGIDEIHIPIAHGEGNFYAPSKILEKMKKNDQIVFQYINDSGKQANGEFPYNPNGALEDIAGICDENGRVFGMMPHPERAIFYFSHPDFQQLKEDAKRGNQKLADIYPPALKVFKNAVEYFAGEGDKTIKELKDIIFN